jgi:hypothetical protein
VIAASFRQEYCPPAMLGRVTASMRFLAFGTALSVLDGLWIVLVIFTASGLFLLTPASAPSETCRPPRPKPNEIYPVFAVALPGNVVAIL